MKTALHPFAIASAVLLLLAGCAAAPERVAAVEEPPAQEYDPGPSWRELPPQPVRLASEDIDALERDRRAIRAMAGEYRVRFAFDETVPLAPGYELHEPKRSGATEWVEVIEDTPHRIVLQHILVIGDEHHVVKHWRQDWTYEPTHMLVFRGDRTWDKVAIAPEQARGKWMQSVWEVDDAPRYSGLGTWEHRAGQSAWTSGPSWRPLPRREYTTRDDYDILRVVNRHLLTPTGWVHEQDNTKIDLVDGRENPIAKEFGLNTYTRIEGYDFSAGREYWEDTRDYWTTVRAAWDDLIDTSTRISLHEKLDDKLMFEHFFAQAERAAQGETIPRSEIDALLQRFERGDGRVAARH